MDCYVYFKAAVADEQRVILQASAVLQNVRAACGVDGTLQRRPEAVQEMHTWMEVYRQVPANFSVLLYNACAATALQTLIAGERHEEFFMDVNVCA